MYGKTIDIARTIYALMEQKGALNIPDTTHMTSKDYVTNAFIEYFENHGGGDDLDKLVQSGIIDNKDRMQVCDILVVMISHRYRKHYIVNNCEG